MEDFDGKLQELVKQLDAELKGDVLIIMGDWNAKIGESGALLELSDVGFDTPK